MNCFYASVEMMLNPALRDKAVAVCGSTEDRHGIVLAKSEEAKKYGNENKWTMNAEKMKECMKSVSVGSFDFEIQNIYFTFAVK